MARSATVAFLLLVFALVGCDSPSAPANVPPMNREPPARPGGAPLGDGPGRLYAVSRFHLGDGTQAWQSVGYDLDSEISAPPPGKAFANHCLPVAGASPRTAFGEGPEGIDNAFGKNIVPMLHSAIFGFEVCIGSNPCPPPSPPHTLDIPIAASVDAGQSTLLLWLSDLGDKARYTPIKAYAMGARNRENGAWHIASESVLAANSNDIAATMASSSAPFTDSYVTGNTWVSSPSTGVLSFVIMIGEHPVHFQIHHPIVTMQLSADHATATNGVIAGVLATEDVVHEADLIMQNDADFCPGSQARDSILNQVRQASDILIDGTQDPTVPCNGISIGLAFEAAEAQAAGIADPPPVPSKCAP